jgi:hypothetical protein
MLENYDFSKADKNPFAQVLNGHDLIPESEKKEHAAENRVTSSQSIEQDEGTQAVIL